MLIAEQFKNRFEQTQLDERLSLYKIATYLDAQGVKATLSKKSIRLLEYSEIRIKRIGIQTNTLGREHSIDFNKKWVASAIVCIRLHRHPMTWHEELVTGVGHSREECIEDMARYYCHSSLQGFLSLLMGEELEGVYWLRPKGFKNLRNHDLIASPVYMRGDITMKNALNNFLYDEISLLSEIDAFVDMRKLNQIPSVVLMMWSHTHLKRQAKAWVNNIEDQRLSDGLKLIMDAFDASVGTVTMKMHLIFLKRHF